MSRLARLLHRQFWLSALLLGCLVLRAFVPAGYMLDTTGGDLGLKMCSGLTLAAPLGGDDHRDGTPPGSEGPTGHQGACPAGIPFLALAYALTLTAEIAPAASAPPPAESPAVSSMPPSPSRLPRGPPTHLA